jgi:hypothetical protein
MKYPNTFSRISALTVLKHKGFVYNIMLCSPVNVSPPPSGLKSEPTRQPVPCWFLTLFIHWLWSWMWNSLLVSQNSPWADTLELFCTLPELHLDLVVLTQRNDNSSSYGRTAKEISISKSSVSVACVLLWICASTNWLSRKFHIVYCVNTITEMCFSKHVTIQWRPLGFVLNCHLFNNAQVSSETTCISSNKYGLKVSYTKARCTICRFIETPTDTQLQQ